MCKRPIQDNTLLIDGGVADVAADPAANVREVWAHLSMLYECHWRPTFTRMQRRPPSFGDDGTIPLGVASCTVPGQPPLPEYITVWELMSSLDLNEAITAKCFRLVASAIRACVVVEPWKQRVQPFGVGGFGHAGWS